MLVARIEKVMQRILLRTTRSLIVWSRSITTISTGEKEVRPEPQDWVHQTWLEPRQLNSVNDELKVKPREFYGVLRNVKSSPRKLNLVAKLIRGMSIADAFAQIQFCEKKASNFIEMVLLDTHRSAVEKDAEPLNLWIAESFVGKGKYFKRIKYHGRGMHGIMCIYHSHYFLKMREGKAPKKTKKPSWKRKTELRIQAGPRSIPNAL